MISESVNFDYIKDTVRCFLCARTLSIIWITVSTASTGGSLVVITAASCASEPYRIALLTLIGFAIARKVGLRINQLLTRGPLANNAVPEKTI